MRIWRVTRAFFVASSASAFSGEGASYTRGRWNSRGVRVANASTTIALSILEYLANLKDRSLAPDDLRLIGAEIPDDAIEDVSASVPADWRFVPPPASTAAFGDAWIMRPGSSLAITVPSVVLPAPPIAIERNVLVNPLHARFGEITYDNPEPINLDERLIV